MLIASDVFVLVLEEFGTVAFGSVIWKSNIVLPEIKSGVRAITL